MDAFPRQSTDTAMMNLINMLELNESERAKKGLTLDSGLTASSAIAISHALENVNRTLVEIRDALTNKEG